MSASTGDDFYIISTTSVVLFSGDSGATFVPSAVSGDSFGIYSFSPIAPPPFVYLYLPDGYAGGTISGSMTFTNLSLASLGVIEQTIAWGAGADQRANISVVPEPSSIGLLIGLAGLSIVLQRRR